MVPWAISGLLPRTQCCSRMQEYAENRALRPIPATRPAPDHQQGGDNSRGDLRLRQPGQREQRGGNGDRQLRPARAAGQRGAHDRRRAQSLRAHDHLQRAGSGAEPDLPQRGRTHLPVRRPRPARRRLPQRHRPCPRRDLQRDAQAGEPAPGQRADHELAILRDRRPVQRPQPQQVVWLALPGPDCQRPDPDLPQFMQPGLRQRRQPDGHLLSTGSRWR
jgi:hypothetical protein